MANYQQIAYGFSGSSRCFIAAFVVTALVACGDSGGSSGDGDVIDITDGADEPQTLSSQEVTSNASTVIGRNFSNSLSGVDSVVGEDTLALDTEDGFSGTNDLVQDFVGSSLVLDDAMASSTIQSGERIVIDPDESRLCAEELIDELSSDADIARCQALLQDVTVQLTSSDGQSGTVAYLFRENPVVSLGYGGSTDSIAINLGGLKSLIDANDALDPAMLGETSTPATMVGEITFSATTTNDTPGAEAGSVVIAVTNAVQLADADTDLSLGNGELLRVSADAASGEGEFGFDVGAVSATLPFEDDDVLNLDLDGFSALATINTQEDNGDPALTVSNLGIGNGPLFMRVNSVDVLRLTMETFGFSLFAPTEVVATDGQLVEQPASVRIDGNMNIGLMLDNAIGFDATRSEAFMLMFATQAPAGTLLTDSDTFLPDERFGVLQGGPFRVSLNAVDENGSEQVDVVVNSGECLVDADGEDLDVDSFTSGSCL